MPGPCSAPNGKQELTFRTPMSQNGNIDTGKTKVKKKIMRHARDAQFKRETLEAAARRGESES